MAPTRAEDREEKRVRGQIACAECRRLKVRCDRKIPCSSCIRRGCSAVCPNRTLANGQGSRFILSDTADLHLKISEMSQRIRQLEDALSLLQNSVSNEVHPLLVDCAKFDPEAKPPTSTVRFTDGDEAEGSVVESLGTLSISDSGVPKYYGPSAAGFETLLEIKPEEKLSNAESPTLPLELAQQCEKFPWAIDSKTETMNQLESALPSYLRACSLLEIYVEHVSWFCRPLKREDVIEDLFGPFYKNKDDATRRKPHNIAVLYFLFANAALFDLTLPAYNDEAEAYYNLGKAALSLQCIFTSVEMQTVEALILMALYHSMSGHRYSLESAWNITSLAAKLGQQLGLHRDSAPWKLSPKVMQQRRNLFWEVCVQDVLGSLALGRPPAMTVAHIDCEYPIDEEQTVDANGNVQVGYWNWKFWYTHRLYWTLLESAINIKGMSYEEILKVDREIRQMKLPAVYHDPIVRDKPMQHLQHYLTHHYHPVAMVYLHRNYFAESLIKFPHNPLQSPYAHSTLAAYRYGSAAIRECVEHHRDYEQLFERNWTFWTQLFASSVVVGSIAAKAPASNMAQNAFKEMCVGLELLEKGASKAPRAEAAAVVIRDLKERAVKALLRTRTGIPPWINLSNLAHEEELDALASNPLLGRLDRLKQPKPKPTTEVDSQWHPPASDSTEQYAFPPEFLPPNDTMFEHPELVANLGVPSDFQISEFDTVLSSYVAKDSMTPFNLDVSVQQFDIPDFAMEEVGHNDQWTSLLKGFGIGGGF